MPIKGEQQGYTYKVLLNGEWQEVTIQESPLELAELFEQDEEWTRVRHGQWLKNGDRYCECSECHHEGNISGADNYCWYCGAKMDEVEE